MVFPSINESKQPFCVFCVPDASCFGFFSTRIIMKFYYISRSPSTRFSLLLSGHKIFSSIFRDFWAWKSRKIYFQRFECLKHPLRPTSHMPRWEPDSRPSPAIFPSNARAIIDLTFHLSLFVQFRDLKGSALLHPRKISCQLDDWPASTGAGS